MEKDEAGLSLAQLLSIFRDFRTFSDYPELPFGGRGLRITALTYLNKTLFVM
jgi:hypothetical protein